MSKRAGKNLKSALKANITGQSRLFRDAVGGKEMADFYSFQLGHSSSFSLKLNRFKADINVALMDGQGQMLMQSARAKRRPEAIDTVLGAGTYYVKVFPARRREQSRYRLQLSATELPRIVEAPPVSTNPVSTNPVTNNNDGSKIVTVPNSGANPSISKSDGGKIVDVPGSGALSPPIDSDGGKSSEAGNSGSALPATGRLITGTFGNETLVGGAGDDLIAGINGFDLLIGGGGADRFLLGDTSTPYYLGVGYAVITDFNVAQGDQILLTNNAFFPLSSYRPVYRRSVILDAFGQPRDVGTAGIDTEIYWGNDLLAIVQDAIVSFVR
ncbi:calcium-binding protein [Leptolyngbya sp. NK1-12]|uniref:Calcium-binding protein n=1 Tax=Leptolyngbya sp. NK1-12 TaxID=2547451 RepID=A0AA96WL42_9CYAN|nr:calcium-binding protein [Leptolyngbya sp. NK1-12]WNZ27478.1 calcium-binding protein [Leptolyngbya sp. NK1-12]